MFTIEYNDGPISRALRQLDDLMKDMTPVMDEIGEYMVAAMHDRIVTGLAIDGSPFAPKSETTMDCYRKSGEGIDSRPLIHFGDMVSFSFHHSASEDSVLFGSSAPYAAVQHFGAALRCGKRCFRCIQRRQQEEWPTLFRYFPLGQYPRTSIRRHIRRGCDKYHGYRDRRIQGRAKVTRLQINQQKVGRQGPAAGFPQTLHSTPTRRSCYGRENITVSRLSVYPGTLHRPPPSATVHRKVCAS